MSAVDMVPAAPPRPARQRTRRARPPLWSRIVAQSVLVAAFLYFIVPVIWLFVASTKSAGDLYTTPGFGFGDWNLGANLSNLFAYRDGIFVRWLGNSVVYSVVGSALTTLVCAMCGYALAIYQFRGKKILMATLMASLLVPATAIAQPVYLLLVALGLNNTMAGVILPSLVYPFGVLLGYITAQSSVPMSIVEAARIDGAGEMRTFFSISTRMMSSGLTTIALFAFVASWNSFLLPLLVLDDPSLYPVTVGLVDWSEQSRSVAALGTLTIVGSLVSVVPLILLFLLLQRFWQSGLAAGGVKM